MVASRNEAKIQLVVDDNFMDFLLPLLESAKKSIDILQYSFAIGSAAGKLNTNTTPFAIAEKLVALKEQKPRLRIRLYLEGLRETYDRNVITGRYLEDAGIEIVYGATHAKGFCVDQSTVLFGSTNLTHQSLVKNAETNLLIKDKSVAKEFMRYFEHLWEGGGHGGIDLKEPMHADGAFKDVLLEMIGSAKRTLEFSIYFFDQKDIRDAFIKAHERGVKIKGFVHHHSAFAMSYVRRTQKTIYKMKSEGMQDLHFAPGTHFTHSKYLIKDKAEIALGTGNWLNEDVNIHPQLYIHLKNAELAKQLSRHLSRQIEESHVEPIRTSKTKMPSHRSWA
ncbi:phospholipase D-like domain-containing protein [Bdellovibrio reynosensis]|uniref:phospholipase D n=1 Tax=Bdellovibrio reynosensis TaxID=2835041 RepID=A0ABY4C8S8_9BACT|nr:phospholipase D-like domain-containing protein [Bdellovibrio reynosensis]UOF01340.1 phospholipase D-like domain-containing protein [Bdellovibrio reynosensis]